MQWLNEILTLLLFALYSLLWQVKRREVKKQNGAEVNVIHSAKTPFQRYFSNLVRVLTTALFIIILLTAFYEKQWMITSFIPSLNTIWVKLLGFTIGVLGLSVCRIAQVTMGKSWRVGIEEEAKLGLVTTGVFRFVRNPTYTGLYVMLVGLWLINPSALFSHWILAFVLIMEFQVRQEEEYLQQIYGKQYADYCGRTKRYLPYIY